MSKYLCLTNLRLGNEAKGKRIRHAAGSTVTITDDELADELLAADAIEAIPVEAGTPAVAAPKSKAAK